MGWTVLRFVDYPYDGIQNLHPTGLITDLDANGPAYGKLQEGDRLVSINGIPWKIFNGYSAMQVGESVEMVVDRGGQTVSVDINLVAPPTTDTLISMIPMLIALIFWGIGLGVQVFQPADESAVLFFAWCQACAATLTAGVASYLGTVWTSTLFGCMLWIIGPISVHFHMHFPQSVKSKGSRVLLIGLYTVAAIGITVYLIWGPIALRSALWYSLYLSSSRLFLAANLLIVVALLIYSYQHAKTPGTRAKIRIVALGGGLTAIPFVALAVLPDALLQQAIVPYSYAFLLLSILPLTYGYAIFRLHLIEVESQVNRGATYILAFSILGGFYLILYASMRRFLPEEVVQSPLINTLLVLVLASLFFPLYGRIQRLVDTIFYGGWYDYRLGLMHTTQNLEQITDLHQLAKSVAQRLVDTLRLEETCVFLRGLEGEFSVIEVASRMDLSNQPSRSYPVLPRSSLSYLLTLGAVERASLQKALTSVTLTPEELQLLKSEQIHLWVPVIGHEQITGLLALGPKIGGDIFSGEDMDILRVLAQQLGPIIENIHLLTHLRRYASELELRVEERTAELFDAKERAEAILASVGDGVVVTDLQGNIQKVNSAFSKQSGYSASEVVGQNLHEILGEVNNLGRIKEIQATLDKGDVWSGELLNKRKNDDLYDMQLTIAPVRDQEGRIVSYVGSQRDITRQKELDRMKEAFIADVSHELRTPTTNINLYLDILEHSPLEKQSKYMAVINEQSKQLTKLVDDILDLSRLTRAKSANIEFSAVDLNLIAEQVITAHELTASAKGIQLEFIPSQEGSQIFGESNQISRAVTNLVSNSLRYTPQGKICLRVFRSPGQVSVEVQDTGMGIRKEDLPYVFNRFFRGQNVRQSKIHGTGLGLSIVKEIMDLHGGSIEVQSEFGAGSRFCLNFPEHGNR